MKKTFNLLACVAFIITPKAIFAGVTSEKVNPDSVITAEIASSKPFLKNMGQWDSQILYQGNTSVGQVRFLKNGLSLSAFHELQKKNKNSRFPEIEGLVWNMEFKNSKQNVSISSKTEQASVFNYIRSTNEAENFNHVPECDQITYQGIYDFIDIEYYTSGKGLKYDIILNPGADVHDVSLDYKGIKQLNVNDRGELEVATPWYTYNELRPYSYQLIDGKKVEVEVRYKLINKTEFGFEIVGAYDHSQKLIIDPYVRLWGTFLRSSYSYSLDNAVDNSRNVFVTGIVSGPYTLSPGVFITTNDVDGFVAKLDPLGAFSYISIFGGSGVDYCDAISIDNAGNAYVVGFSNSSNSSFPVSGFGTSYVGGSSDGVVCKLNLTGTAFIYSNYFGGLNDDEGYDITVNATTGIAYITGYTNSNTFATYTGAIQGFYGGNLDAFILVINAAGTAINSLTYFGGPGDDFGNCIYRKPTGGNELYIAGTTYGSVPTQLGAFQSSNQGGSDGFVAQFNSAATITNYSSHYGGTGNEEILGMDVNGMDEIYAVGFCTNGSLSTTPGLITPGVLQTVAPGGIEDGFALRFDASASSLIYGTYFGGSAKDRAYDVRVNISNEAFVSGFSYSFNLPFTAGSFQPNKALYINGVPNADLFLTHLNPLGNIACNGTTYIGGTGEDYYYPKLTLDRSTGNDDLIINGTSHSLNFPTTPGTYEPTKINGNEDQTVVMKFRADCILGPQGGVIETPVYDLSVCENDCFHFTAQIVSGNPSIYLFMNGVDYFSVNTGNSLQITICGLSPGTYNAIYFIDNTPYPHPISFSVLPAPLVNLGPDQMICSSGAMTIGVPGVQGESYLWNTGSTDNFIFPTSTGTYTLTVTNGEGCSASDQLVIRKVQDFLQNATICSGQSVQLNAGPDGVSYAWSPATGLNNPSIQNPLATPAQTTTYTVTVTYLSGCTNTGTVTITVPTYSIGGPLTVCKNSCVKLTVPAALCVQSAVWYYSEADGTAGQSNEEFIGIGNTICFTVKKSGTYCVRIITCDGCEYVLCRQITVVTGKECKKLPVTNDDCCTISNKSLEEEGDSENAEIQFSVQPNPFSDDLKLNLTLPLDGFVNIKVYDLSGKEVALWYQKEIVANTQYEIPLDASKLPSGVYIVKLESAQMNQFIKVVKY